MHPGRSPAKDKLGNIASRTPCGGLQGRACPCGGFDGNQAPVIEPPGRKQR